MIGEPYSETNSFPKQESIFKPHDVRRIMKMSIDLLDESERRHPQCALMMYNRFLRKKGFCLGRETVVSGNIGNEHEKMISYSYTQLFEAANKVIHRLNLFYNQWKSSGSAWARLAISGSYHSHRSEIDVLRLLSELLRYEDYEDDDRFKDNKARCAASKQSIDAAIIRAEEIHQEMNKQHMSRRRFSSLVAATTASALIYGAARKTFPGTDDQQAARIQVIYKDPVKISSPQPVTAIPTVITSGDNHAETIAAKIVDSGKTAVPIEKKSEPIAAETEMKTTEAKESKNLVEYFLGDLISKLKQKRLVKAALDSGYKERIDSRFLNSDRINFLFLGLDQTRTRDYVTGSTKGIGRSDVIIVISFDPRTFKTTLISFPRDMYVPEVKPHFPNVPKINTMTMVKAVTEGAFDEFEFCKKIIESATGLPIDGQISVNVDFVQGYPEKDLPSFFDRIFPDGLVINVGKDLSDPFYLKDKEFKKGRQVMDGRTLSQYARSRYSTSDYDRNLRQRQVVKAAIVNLFPRILEDVARGKPQTLDTIIDTLEEQESHFNFYSDLDFVTILRTMRNEIVRLQSQPAVLAALAINTRSLISEIIGDSDGVLVTEGLTPANGMIVPLDKDERLETAVNKIAGSRIDSESTAHGNYLDYYKASRQFVSDLIA